MVWMYQLVRHFEILCRYIARGENIYGFALATSHYMMKSLGYLSAFAMCIIDRCCVFDGSVDALPFAL